MVLLGRLSCLELSVSVRCAEMGVHQSSSYACWQKIPCHLSQPARPVKRPEVCWKEVRWSRDGHDCVNTKRKEWSVHEKWVCARLAGQKSACLVEDSANWSVPPNFDSARSKLRRRSYLLILPPASFTITHHIET